jgi:hypothetical protein
MKDYPFKGKNAPTVTYQGKKSRGENRAHCPFKGKNAPTVTYQGKKSRGEKWA